MLGIKLIQEFKQYVCVRYLHYERVELVSVFQDCLPNINEGITPFQCVYVSSVMYAVGNLHPF